MLTTVYSSSSVCFVFLFVLVLFRYVSYQIVFSVCAVVMGKWKKLKCENQSTETELQK